MTEGSTDNTNGVFETNNVDGGSKGTPDVNVVSAGGVNSEVFDTLFGGESEEWPAQATKKGFRVTWPVMVLVALLLLLGGLGFGAYLQRQQSGSAASTLAAGRAAFFGAPATGTGATTSASTSVTSGTVTDIIGNTLYVTNASGALVPVKVSTTTTVDRNASSSLSGLKPGDTVTVQGPAAKNGSVTATSISATAKGVTPVGFGGGFGGGGFAAGAGGGAAASAGSGTSASTATGG